MASAGQEPIGRKPCVALRQRQSDSQLRRAVGWLLQRQGLAYTKEEPARLPPPAIRCLPFQLQLRSLILQRKVPACLWAQVVAEWQQTAGPALRAGSSSTAAWAHGLRQVQTGR